MKAIFITDKDIKRYSVLDGNLDSSKFMSYVEMAQDIHIQQYLGTDLYEKIMSLIIDDTIDDSGNEVYKQLLKEYIKPTLIQWSLVQLYPFVAYTIANGGVFKHKSETSESVSKEEVDYLQEQSRMTANYYTDRLVSYLCDKSSDFPEYNTNSGSDISPSGETDYLSWII
jgi:DNA integrity scanning protein DisA with diadenylate cyclase activity